MGIVERIIIQNARESNWLDFKTKIDFPNKRIDFLRDIMAFANNDYIGKQYIIYGIKENIDQLEILGLDSSSFDKISDEASYQELISNKIEPRIEISLYKDKYENKEFLVLEINADKLQRPFMFRNDYGVDNEHVYKGEAWIREGSRKDRMCREDFNNLYSKKIAPLEVELTDYELFLTDNDPGNLEMIIKNHSPITRLYTSVYLEVLDDQGKRKVLTKMRAFKTIELIQNGTFDLDFSLKIDGFTEQKGIGKFCLSTSEVAMLGVDEFGCSDIKYTFKLYFRNSCGDTIFTFENCSVFAKEGLILRKVKKSTV